MLHDIRQAASWGERCQVLIARTGWQPGSIPEAARRQKNDLSQFHVYDPAVASARRVYGGLQILGATLVLLWAQLQVLNGIQAWLIFILLLWTGVATAWWLEGRAGAHILIFDLARLASLAVFTWVHAADALWGALLGLWWISSVAFLMTSVAARKWQWNGGETSRVGS
jgi:hypothetical protein